MASNAAFHLTIETVGFQAAFSVSMNGRPVLLYVTELAHQGCPVTLLFGSHRLQRFALQALIRPAFFPFASTCFT
jgi:hypothetical protein